MRTISAHKCAGHGCKETVPSWVHLCKRCWQLLPGWMRARLYTEKRQCKTAGIRHSQELHRLQEMAQRTLTELLCSTSQAATPPQASALPASISIGEPS